MAEVEQKRCGEEIPVPKLGVQATKVACTLESLCPDAVLAL